jgi:hypothetical protein
VLLLLTASSAEATPEFVAHQPLAAVYGEPASVTMPREGEPIAIWVRVGYSFYYDDLAIYYTTDGSDPSGSQGVPDGTTQVLRFSTGGVEFVRNEPAVPANIDWWRAVLPPDTRAYGTPIKYRIGAWHSGGGGEVFANNSGCADGTCDDPAAPAATFSYTVRLAWPGRGHPHTSPGEGFPEVHFWKEEAVVGNNYMNVQLDQNGTVYDIYFPSAGCVQGVGTKNEGYVDGLDTFPPGLPLGYRGQMHLNQALAGLRVAGTTFWLSNEGGAYVGHEQRYLDDNNVIYSACTLSAAGAQIRVEQYDYCPKGIGYPSDQGNQPIRGIYIKRFLLRNESDIAQTVDFYYNADFAINGGDSYDMMFADTARGALIGYDRTQRQTSASGEYNPTSFGDYTKDVSIYLAAAVKLCDAVGSSTGIPASDSWRDSSPDNAAGWAGLRLLLAPGQTQEVDVAIVGGFDDFPGATGTYDYKVAPALDWFHATSMADVQASTEEYWTGWLAAGVDVDFPDDDYDALFRRSLLATALHVDAAGGGVIAGMHNGAYPFVWPRDALYAAVTLDRTGHTAEAGEVFRFLRDVAYRDSDAWGKGFWYQKYTTDGYIVWSAPQVDETANVTWAGWHHFLTTGDLNFLDSYYPMFYEAGRAMSEDSAIDSRLFFDEANNLMHSNNVWEDSFDEFLYSNATVERGLRDLVRIADVLDEHVCPDGPGTCNYHNDETLFSGRADLIHAGLNGRLDWDGENTDISQLGLAWPFETHTPVDPRITHVVDRINGVATDRFGHHRPLVNDTGEFQDLINRYWGDTYWNGGPWFLTTLWYGQYYAQRQDYFAGKADIDNFKLRIDRTRDFLGPVGLGAEQMAPGNSLLYPGQPDFRLQAAWPNAWESMSFLVDCLMLFLDHRPDARNNHLELAPKLPTGWSTLSYRNLHIGLRRIDITVSESATLNSHTFTNVSGGDLTYETYVRLPAVAAIRSVQQNGAPVAHTYESEASRIRVIGSLDPTATSITTVAVVYNNVRGDFDHDGDVDLDDFGRFQLCMSGPEVTQSDVQCAPVLLDDDDDVDQEDFGFFQRCISGAGMAADVACE